MSLPPTVEFRDAQLSADGQQLSPGKHLQVAFEKASESEGVAQTPSERRADLILSWKPTGDSGTEERVKRPPA